ncbi:MAG: DUF1588 domain-containing protein [Myxococcales bacterium]|nr:DUF1588 domain-containing protein [Myxococcales bacterium]
MSGRTRPQRWRRRAAAWVALSVALGACGEDEPKAAATEVLPPAQEVRNFAPGPIAMRRLTRGQYVASLRGVFGQDLKVLPPTEVDVAMEGLLTVGAKVASVTPAGMEGYLLSARQVAGTVLEADRRDQVVPCTPKDPKSADDACAKAFVQAVGPLLLRRALHPDETPTLVQRARTATEKLGDFWAGLEAVLIGWLISPDFLFIQERSAADTAGTAGVALSPESLASRLSYFFWGRGPDAALLAAAADGSLATDAGYKAQVVRLIADAPSLERGVRALFSDLLSLDKLASVNKDNKLYPAFTAAAIEDAREQTLRTIVDHLLVRRADYRDLFTTRKTFMTRNLGPIYDVPVAKDWSPYEFPADGARAGLLSQVSFLALNARAVRSSPVLRGVFVLDRLLCTPIPPPPPDVSFDAVATTSNNAPTARERLAVHRVNPSCNGCHKVMDNIGLALENFDAAGRFRTHEAGHAIDTSGDLMGAAYGDVRGFYKVLHDAPNLAKCMVKKLFMHSVGREYTGAEVELVNALNADFAKSGFDFVALMREIALSHGFRATEGPVLRDDKEVRP